MKPTINIHAIIKTEDGKRKLIPNSPLYFHTCLNSFKENEKVVLSIQRIKGFRTLSQNAFYWMYLTIIAQEFGDNENDLHEVFKRKFLPPRFVRLTSTGDEVKLPATTTTLSKNDFSEYLDKICGITGVPIPDPKLAGFVK